MNDFYTIPEVAAMFRRDRRTIYRLIHAGKLRPVNISSGKTTQLRISASELRRFEKAQTLNRAA